MNDLFVTPAARRRGAGSALIETAGARRLVLSTELTNSTAQSTYERLGWKRDTVFCQYRLEL